MGAIRLLNDQDEGAGVSGGLLGDDPFAPVTRVAVHNLVAGTPLLVTRSAQTKDVLRTRALRLFAAAHGVETSDNDGDDDDADTLGTFRRALRAWARGRSRRAERLPALTSAVGQNLATIAELLALDDVERDVLVVVVAAQASVDFRQLASAFDDLTVRDVFEMLAVFTGRKSAAVAKALRPTASLRSSGLVTIREGSQELCSKLDTKDGLVDLVMSGRLDRDTLIARFLPRAPASTLSLDDVEPLRAEIECAKSLLAKALQSQHRGVNILLYGPSGTGKTEVARLLADALGVGLFGVGTCDDDGDPASASERLGSLRLGHQLLGKAPAMLLFDELEDLFEWSTFAAIAGLRHASARMSKQWFNDVLEGNSTPTIWISNATDGIDPAFLRRFMLAIEFRPFGRAQRVRVLRRHLGEPAPLGDSDLDAIVERFTASPAQIATAVAGAKLLSATATPTREALESMLAPVEKLVTGVDPARRDVFDAASYRVDLLHASENLDALASRLAGWRPGPRQGLSLCFYGRPGTGKTEFARYLAHRMGRRVVHRRVSDIFSMWVGATERNLAQAFREACDEEAVLVFDEADSFLRDRSDAVRSWEVTQVNEFLQQLERHPGVVVCTTNLWRGLDAASLRRFVFKVEFHPLRPEHVAPAIVQAFGEIVATPIEVVAVRRALDPAAGLHALTHGDLAVVARRLRATGERPTLRDVIALLAGECAAREPEKPAVGFRGLPS